MIAADLARAGVVAALAALAAARAVTVAVLLSAVAAATVLSCVSGPTSQAVIPEVIGQDRQTLDRFNGRYWIAAQLGRDFAGPPLGSVAFAAARALPFAADAVSFLASAALIGRLPRPRARACPQARAPVTAGLRHVFATPGLRARW